MATQSEKRVRAGSSIADFYTPKMEVIYSSETSDYTISTLRHIPEDGILNINFIVPAGALNYAVTNQNT
jgi:hypothetical protein